MDELIAEIKRRSTGCVLATMTIDEKGDCWRFSGKGSKVMLKSLFFQLEDRFLPEREDEDGESVKKCKH